MPRARSRARCSSSRSRPRTSRSAARRAAGARAAAERHRPQETSWKPASAEEGFEIVRRRLFEDVPATWRASATRSSTRSASSTSAEGRVPVRVRRGRLRRRLTASYPIHPELFDHLFDDWSTLEKFQRTRGVLRLMAAVIHELWGRDDRSLLIMPASVPIDAPRRRRADALPRGGVDAGDRDRRRRGERAAAAARPREPDLRALLGDAAGGAHDLMGSAPIHEAANQGSTTGDQARLRPAGRVAGDLRRRAAAAGERGDLPRGQTGSATGTRSSRR